MKGHLTSNQIEYVFYHFNLAYQFNDAIREYFRFLKYREQIDEADSGIVFPLSSAPLDLEKIPWIENIPVLFPVSNEKTFYKIEHDRLIFHHDLLKSAFYLLSGYQEYGSDKKDHLNRYPFTESIQYQLGIVQRPIVNYYFKIIFEGIKKFCKRKNLVYKRETLFDKPVFMLTHDIDRVDYYDIHRIKLLLKQLAGFKEAKDSKQILLKSLIVSVIQYLNFMNRKNPSWNFSYLRKIEKKHGISSVFYFLHKDQLHIDSYYTFKEKRIQKLIHWLEKEGCEIGIHGTVKSATDYENSKTYLDNLNSVSDEVVDGIRQHRLTYEHTVTTRIHEKLPLLYDTTLGFAEHEGFRNSFCLPFKLYDFENDRMFSIWEIPLNVMDVTLFHHRQLDLNEAYSVIKNIIKEVETFKGIFTLLWHNTFFDERNIPGITKFYEDILQLAGRETIHSICGGDIINKVNNHCTETLQNIK